MFVVGAMALVLSACGGAEPVGKDTAGIASMEQGLLGCGIYNCPTGYHPVYWQCSSSCPGYPCTTGPNAFECSPDMLSSFTSCGYCPDGYEATSSWFTSDCATSWPAGGEANTFNCTETP